MGNEECASASFLSLFRPHHRIPLSLSLSRPRSPPGVWTGRFKRIPSVVGSARLAGSSWRHEAATTSAICFEYELTIALVKCHEHVYRCITTRMIRRSDSGFRGSLSVQKAYLRFSRGWDWVNGIGGIIGGTRIDEIPFVLFFFFFFFSRMYADTRYGWNDFDDQWFLFVLEIEIIGKLRGTRLIS